MFMCTADEKMSHRICFAFLQVPSLSRANGSVDVSTLSGSKALTERRTRAQDIRKHFLGMFSDSYMRATEGSLNERFRILNERMVREAPCCQSMERFISHCRQPPD